MLDTDSWRCWQLRELSWYLGTLIGRWVPQQNYDDVLWFIYMGMRDRLSKACVSSSYFDIICMIICFTFGVTSSSKISWFRRTCILRPLSFTIRVYFTTGYGSICMLSFVWHVSRHTLTMSSRRIFSLFQFVFLQSCDCCCTRIGMRRVDCGVLSSDSS